MQSSRSNRTKPHVILSMTIYTLEMKLLQHWLIFSINTGCVPNAWKHWLVTPVLKTQPITSVADYRPISVSPIFSRISEQLTTRDYFIPYIPDDCLLDQYAYKITGSTTSMLVWLTDTVGRLLESNQYVRCIMIDFSKAFDTVNHETLLSKLKLSSCSSEHR